MDGSDFYSKLFTATVKVLDQFTGVNVPRNSEPQLLWVCMPTSDGDSLPLS